MSLINDECWWHIQFVDMELDKEIGLHVSREVVITFLIIVVKFCENLHEIWDFNGMKHSRIINDDAMVT